MAFRVTLYLLGIILIATSCVKDRNFEVPDANCTQNLEANASFAQVKALYGGELLQIQEDLVIEGYVVSSDRAGNFFSVLYFQDQAVNATEGFQIQIDVRDNHLFYPVGSKILIKLKGLYLGQRKGAYTLGGTFDAFGTTTVGRLPALKVSEHIFVSCNEVVDVSPKEVSIPLIDAALTNTLVRFQDVEFLTTDLDSLFAVPFEETERTLVDCLDNELKLITSGFADFQAEQLPQRNGSITGVLLQENNNYFLAIRDLEDIDFTEERCEELLTEFTSTQFFFSELADPNNNTGARFIELYNAASEPLDLNGWTIRRYTNASTDVSSIIDLSEFVIAAGSTLVISPNANEFELVYGFVPDLEVGTNSPADSNGDDNLELVDPFGDVVDVFGVPGEDGTGTNHEFEDGKAIRNLEVSNGNPTYTFSEWIIFNDSGGNGTINIPQNAPVDFSPGSRN